MNHPVELGLGWQAARDPRTVKGDTAPHGALCVGPPETVARKIATRSQDNVMRRGFELLYTRAILVKGQDAEGRISGQTRHR